MNILYSFLRWLVLSASLIYVLGNSCPDAPRRRYMLALMEFFAHSVYVSDVILNVASDSGGHVNITAPFLHLKRTHSLKTGVTTMHLNKTIIAYSNGTEHKGILLESDVDITVRVMTKSNRNNEEQEGYLALPLLEDGTHSYVVSSWEPAIAYYSEYLIASAADNTTVVITTVGIYKQQHSVMLNKYDTYQQKFHSDTSGTVIHANGPVSVFSGSQCTSIPFGSFCQSLIEQLAPVASWGKQHIVPSLKYKPFNIVRVYTANDTTAVTISNSSSSKTIYILSSFQYKEFEFKSEPLLVQSDKPIQVMQYSPSYTSGYHGDPFMMTIPDTDSFLTEYRTKPMTLYKNLNMSAVILTVVKAEDRGLFLNGQPISNRATTDTAVTPLGDYTVLTVPVASDAEYKIVHDVSGVAFGALLFGYIDGKNVGYGFPLGRKLKNNECLTSALTTSESPARTPTSWQHVPISQLTSSHPGTDLISADGRGPICYDCKYVTSLDECTYVRLCNLGQVCSAVQFEWGGAGAYYHQGCSDIDMCEGSSHHGRSVPVCDQCCNSDFCNTACNQTVHQKGLKVTGQPRS